MYIKIVGSLFFMCSAAAIGFMKAEELKVRVKRLQELKRMMLLLQGELRFHRAALSEAFESVAERMEEPFQSFLSETAGRLEQREAKGFEGIWEEMSGKLLQTEGFQKEDERLLEVLRNGLGYLDLAMQTETLNLAMIQAEEAVRIAKEQQESRGKLYRTMGVTVGALLTLLII